MNEMSAMKLSRGRSIWYSVVGVAILCLVQSAFGQSAKERVGWTTSRVVGAPTPPEPYRVELAFPEVRFKLPTSLEQFPTGDQLLVTEIGGKVWTFSQKPGGTAKRLVGELGDVALFDAEFHPQFKRNQQLFLCYVQKGKDAETRVSRFRLRGEPPVLDRESEQVLLTWPAGGHNGGCLEFGADGLLYISTGDGAGPNPPDGLTTGQDVSDLLGAILRIDVDRGSKYVIPAGNPFVKRKGARGEIFAYGLRNPFKFGIDKRSGDLFVADNGWETWELIHHMRAGSNGGWPVMEGRAILRGEVPIGPTPITPPLKDHHHSEANSVIGGPVYDGQKLSDLAGTFVYGDYITGTIWGVRVDPDGSANHRTLVDTDLRIVAFHQSRSGDIYVVDYDFTGQIYRLLPSNRVDNSREFPRQLSETGIFRSLAELEPAAGVEPYDVVVQRWMDGAVARRWIALPGNQRVHLSSDRNQFPEGTVLVKHLELPQGKKNPIRLETQLLHYEAGVWRPYTYRWNDEGRDARLVASEGGRRTLLTIAGERTWHNGAVNECKLCHNAGSGFVLGFEPSQLALTKDDRQLHDLIERGILADDFSSPTANARLVDPWNGSQDINDRARSYLHGNCAMCHHPGGNAIVSFYLSRELPFAELRTDKGTGIGTFGLRDAKLIVPGDPYRSVLMYRMSKLGYSRMPYIGSYVVDGQGIALMDEWIRGMPRNGSPSLPLQPTSPAGKAIASLSAGGAVGETEWQHLLATTESVLALAVTMHRNAGIGGDDAIFNAVRQQTNAIPSTDRRGLLETFLPENLRRLRLGPNPLPETILDLSGNRDRGKLIYFSDNARCRACHQNDAKLSLGPSLPEIRKKYPKRAELLAQILQPSAKIDEKFRARTIVTVDGRVITGLLLEESADKVVIRNVERQIISLATSDIDQVIISPRSLMPDKTLSDLTTQEAADLLEFLIGE
jgi:putative heme-binding domain-containing protein